MPERVLVRIGFFNHKGVPEMVAIVEAARIVRADEIQDV